MVHGPQPHESYGSYLIATPKELSIETRSSQSALAQGFSELSDDPIVESKGRDYRPGSAY